MSVFCVVIVFAVDYNDGQIHNITTYIAGPTARVDYQYSGPSTTINILPGGSFNDIRMYNESILNLLGGTVRDVIFGEDFSHINIESRLVQYNILASDKCIVNMTGGNVVHDIVIMNEAELSFSNSSASDISTYHNSKSYIESGTIGRSCYTYDNSQLIISGGTINENLRVFDSSLVDFSGGLVGGDLIAAYSSVLTIYGSDFAINGISVGYGEYFASDYSNGHLTGTLVWGDALDNDFVIQDTASIVLIPEPATVLLLGLGVVMMRRKVKSQTSKGKVAVQN
jgi:hypothetical protein